jgi:hypothetical protein
MMRALVVALLLAGCESRPLDNGDSDLGDVRLDLATTPVDLAGLSCAMLGNELNQSASQYQSCNADSDCTWITPIGNLCDCLVLNQSAAPIYAAYAAAWNGQACGGGPCACDTSDIPICRNHICLAGPPPKFGDPCTSDGQCPSEGQYVGSCQHGRCVLPCAHGFGCPSGGMVCVSSGGVPGYCWPACDLQSSCNSGLVCCPIDGVMACYPGCA